MAKSRSWKNWAPEAWDSDIWVDAWSHWTFTFPWSLSGTEMAYYLPVELPFASHLFQGLNGDNYLRRQWSQDLLFPGGKNKSFPELWVPVGGGGHKERDNEGEYGGCVLYQYM
jgi:hypothetical protein